MKKFQRFQDRTQAGQLLAARLSGYASRDDVLVLALPRGGVPVGFAIASRLQVALDVLVVRKIGMPGHEEFALGAIASGGKCLLQTEVIHGLNIAMPLVEAVAARELEEIARREKLYRHGRPPPQLRERTVILVDDGLASGATMRVAVQLVREALPARLIVALPVAAPDNLQTLKDDVDELVCLEQPQPFYSVGHWYEDFEQTSDEEVTELLEKNRQRPIRTG